MEEGQGSFSKAVCDETALVDMSLHPTPFGEEDPLKFDIKKDEFEICDEKDKFYPDTVIKEEVYLQNQCDSSWHQTEEFFKSSKSSQVKDEEPVDMWLHPTPSEDVDPLKLDSEKKEVDVSDKFHSEIVIEEEVDFQNLCDLSCQQTVKFSVTCESRQVQNEELWHYMKEEFDLYIEDKHSKGICINCLHEFTEFNLDVLLKSFCDSCYTSLYNNGHEALFNRMSSCEMCVNGLYNSIKLFEHFCTRTDVYICDHCHNIYKSKQQIEHHITHPEYKYEKHCVQKGGHNYEYGKHNIKQAGNKIRIDKMKFSCEDGHVVGSCIKNVSSNIQSDVTYCKMNIVTKNKIPQTTKRLEKNQISKHCGNAFTQSSIIERIETTYLGIEAYVCKYCKKAFTKPCSLKLHEMIHSGEKPHICKYCKKVFTRSSSLKQHEMIHTGEKPYICKHCKNGFNRLDSLKLHVMRLHTGENPHICKYCKKGFTWSSSLKQHEMIHTGEKPNICKYCKKGFNRLVNLKKHEMIHTGEKPHICKYCKKGFIYANGLKLHEMIHTGEKPHICKYCKKGFIYANSLKEHEMIHTGEKSNICKYCKKGFTQSGTLKQHEMMHTGEKPNICKYCKKGFTRSSNLKQHEMIHTGEKRYICKHCKNRFTRLDSLKLHVMRLHTGEKPHVCKYCKKRFIQSSHLKRHEMIHTGEKPHICKYCKKRFIESSHLKRHEMIHTGEKPHPCVLSKGIHSGKSIKT